MLAEESVEAWREVARKLKSERMSHRGSAGSRDFGVVHVSSSLGFQRLPRLVAFVLAFGVAYLLAYKLLRHIDSLIFG